MIGYTTGTYDLFHDGHVEFLKNAKSLCSYLIVGVTNDELGFNEKGKKPILNLNQRMKIVGACKYVDMVIEHNNVGGDKVEPWNRLKFDYVFIGDDWKDDKSYTELKNKIPVKVIFLPYTKSVSSTQIRNSLLS